MTAASQPAPKPLRAKHLAHPADPAPARWLTIDEAADLAKVSRRTIYYWFSKGKLVTCRTAGGGLRIEAESLFRED